MEIVPISGKSVVTDSGEKAFSVAQGEARLNSHSTLAAFLRGLLQSRRP